MASHFSGISRFNAAGAVMRPTLGAVLVSVALLWAGGKAAALSEIQQQETSEQGEQIERQTLPPTGGMQPGDAQEQDNASPQPDAAAPGTSADENEEGDIEGSAGKQAGRLEIDPNAPIPEPVYDLEKLPEPVKRMRDLIVTAAKSGDIEALRPLLEKGPDGTVLSFGGVEGDPIAFLRDGYSESDGQELLAILEEVLSAGYVHLDPGTPEEIYVWPYFAAVPLERLDPRQRVELFKILTAYDYEEMKAAGTYTFYRAGISPQGRWEFFVAGD